MTTIKKTVKKERGQKVEEYSYSALGHVALFRSEKVFVAVVAESTLSRSLIREVRAENVDQAKEKIIKAGFVIRRDPMPESEWKAKYEPIFVEHN